MAQTKKKRNRKKRGTQAGNVDERRRTRPKNRAEARNQAKTGSKSRGPREDSPPTWRSAVTRGVVASLVFLGLLMLLFGRGLTQALPISLFMLVFYIPAGYYMDLTLWRRRERARIRARGGKKG